MTLKDGKLNTLYRISSIDNKKSEHLVNLGLYDGTDVIIKSRGLGSMIICVGDSRYGLGEDIAKTINIE